MCFSPQLRKQFLKNINDTCRITQLCVPCTNRGAVLVETDTPSVARALLDVIVSSRKSKPEKHGHVHFSLLKFLSVTTKTNVPGSGFYGRQGRTACAGLRDLACLLARAGIDDSLEESTPLLWPQKWASG